MSDAIVVGPGAGGGMLARVLTESGAQVLLLEAGGHNIDHDLRHHQRPWELPQRDTYMCDEQYVVRLPIVQHVVGQGEVQATT